LNLAPDGLNSAFMMALRDLDVFIRYAAESVIAAPNPVMTVLRLHDRAQPRVGSAQPGSVIRHGLIGHAPQAPTPAGTPQIDKRRSGPARRHP
jgi:hypothetical protein